MSISTVAMGYLASSQCPSDDDPWMSSVVVMLLYSNIAWMDHTVVLAPSRLRGYTFRFRGLSLGRSAQPKLCSIPRFRRSYFCVVSGVE